MFCYYFSRTIQAWLLQTETSAKVISLNTMGKLIHRRDSTVAIRKRCSVIGEVLAQNTHEFFKNTTLHGLRYLSHEDLNPVERFFFGMSFVTVVLLSGFFIIKVFDKWDNSPVILGINPIPSFITEEPFPAVTICNLNQAYKSKAEQYSIFSTEYATLQMLCKREVNVTVADTITDWSNLNNFIYDISQPCSNMLLSCRFGSVEYNCTDIFHPIVTDEGLCCVFNMVHPTFRYKSNSFALERNVSNSIGYEPVTWNAEDGYPKLRPKHYVPRTAAGVGETLGLSLILDVDADNYYCSSSNSIGFKLTLHSPNETPNVREIGLLLSAGRETKVRIRSEKMESSQDLHSINRRYRQCLFQREENLIVFSDYSQRNCEIECLGKLMLKYCGCISHFMPKLHANDTICSIYDATCVERVRLTAKLTEDDELNCNDSCWPSCFDLTYIPDFFSSPLSHSGFQIADEILKNLSSAYVERNIANVHLYFHEYAYRSFKQTEFIGTTDVLSSVGGLIGLFFGFSFISLAEFIFYALLRPFRILRKTKSECIKIKAEKRTRSKSPIKQYSPRINRIPLRFKRSIGFNAGLSKQRLGLPNKTLNLEQTYLSKEFLTSVFESVNKPNTETYSIRY